MNNMNKNFIYISSLLSSLFIFIIIPHGPDVSPDSVVYLMAADSFISGKGFLAYNKPLTHFPPLYPILIGLISFFLGIETIQSARIISSLFMGLNIFIIAKLIMIIHNNIWFNFFLLLFFIVSSVMFLIHTMALTEPIFLFLILLFLLCYYNFLNTNKIKYLVFSSFIIGLASILRYAGIFLFVSILILNIIYLKNIKEKILYSVISFTISLIFPMGWFLRNYFTALNLTNRELVFHFFNISDLKQLIYTFMFFIYPLDIVFLKKINVLSFFYFLIVFSLFIILSYSFVLFKEKNVNNLNFIFIKIVLFLNLTYILFIILSKLIYDAYIPLDYRILLPSLITLFLILFIFSYNYLAGQKKIFFIYLLIISFFFNLYYTFNSAKSIFTYGRGYNSVIWKNSTTIKDYKYIKENRRIFSNGIDAIWFLTRDYAESLPIKYDASTTKINEKYEDMVKNIFSEIEQDKAIIIFFKNITWRRYFPTDDELLNYARQKNLKINTYEDGIIIRSPAIQKNADDP